MRIYRGIKWIGVGLIAIYQLFFALIIRIILAILLWPRTVKPAGLKIPRGTLILANHQSFFDPFLIISNLGWLNLIRNMPVRAPVASVHIRRWIKGIPLRLVGGYDVGSTSMERARALIYTRELIENKFSVLLFPEGKVVREQEQAGEFQRGMRMVMQDDTPILLIRIGGLMKWSIFGPNEPVTLTFSEVIAGNKDEKITAAENFLKSSN